MARKTTGDREVGFMRSAWEEIDEIERAYNCAVTVTVTPAKRKGGFIFRISALHLNTLDGDVERRSAVQREFPNAQAVTLAGFFWTLTAHLSNLVVNEDVARATLERQGG